MIVRFVDVVSALCTALALHHEPSISGQPRCYNHVSRFVLKQVENIPTHVQMPLILATYLFGLSSILFFGLPFTHLNQGQRLAWITRWKGAALSPFRDFVRFYEGLSLFVLYSESNV